ncbi:MAG: hypothetical protein RJB55_1452 [Verrucomicrobiota bacterium]
MPRKTYGKKDAEQAEALRVTQAKKLSEASAGAEGPVRLWMRDEHRYGLLPAIRRCRGLRGVRVRAPYATRYQWGYLHEALEVDCVNRLELLLTQVIDQDFNAAFLRQISETRPTGRHNVIQGQAGIHIQSADSRRPANVRLVPLPPYSSDSTQSRGSATWRRTPPASGSSPLCVPWRTRFQPNRNHCTQAVHESGNRSKTTGFRIK